MQFGERTKRTAERPAGARLFPWAYIEIHLFSRGRFGAFCDGLPGVVAISCVLDKGGEQA